MQLGMVTRSHRLWTWSRLEFGEDVLEGTSEVFQAVTWVPRSEQLQDR